MVQPKRSRSILNFSPAVRTRKRQSRCLPRLTKPSKPATETKREQPRRNRFRDFILGRHRPPFSSQFHTGKQQYLPVCDVTKVYTRVVLPGTAASISLQSI